jgi:hypothetical protein
MNVRNIAICLIVLLLSGCAGYGGYGYQGRPYGYDNASLLGGAGALVGATVTNSHPVLGAVALGLGGYYLGQQLDARQAQIGWTDCQSTIVRQYNRDGTVSVVQHNTESCRSGMQTQGYRSGFNR